MFETVSDLWNRLVQGENVNQDEVLWGALFIGMLFAGLHLLTMLVTRWGDQKATSKSLIFSVLVHLSCGLGLLTVNPPEAAPRQKEKIPEAPQQEEPFQLRQTVLLTGVETLNTDQSGNTPIFQQLPKPEIAAVTTRRERLPQNPQPLPSLRRVAVPIHSPSAQEPNAPSPEEDPVAAPAPENFGDKGPIRIAKIPERVIDPTALRSPVIRIPSRKISRVPLKRFRQIETKVIRETSRGAADRTDEPKDLKPKLASDQSVNDPSSLLRKDRPRPLKRRRLAPVRSHMASTATGAAARRITPGSGGGNSRPQPFVRMRTRPIGGVREGSLSRVRSQERPQSPRPRTARNSAVQVGPSPSLLLDAEQPKIVSGKSPTRSSKRRRTNLPATYRLRSLAKRKASAEKYGGTDGSERAVERALRWLAAHQNPGGYWDADAYGSGKIGKDERGINRKFAGKNADTGITALALLAFLGAGYTHEEGPYARTVEKALRWLVSQQREDGFLGGNAGHYAKMYCHGMAAYAIAEAYGMQSDPTIDTRLRKPLAKAVDYILNAQNSKDGGWRYLKGQVSDMSMFGWQLMALKSAETAGLHVPVAAKKKMIQFLIDRSSGPKKGLARYQQRYKVSATMTAEALFCKQIFRIERDHTASREAVAYLMQRLPRLSKLNLYYWYYGTLAMFQYGGKEWRQWNGAVREALIAEQTTSGKNAGSWDPKGPWGPYGGRIYSTALSALCLEVYYRFLPLYNMSGRSAQP